MNPWMIIGVMLAISGAYGAGHWRGDSAGQAYVRHQWDQEKAKQMAEYAENMRLAREKEQALQQGANHLREEKDREIRNINARATALANSLRDRPDRPTTESGAMSGTTGTCSGATGAQLARSDGEFLAGYAADAAKLKTALDQCVKQYETLRH